MTVERGLRLMAGTFILLSLGLGHFVSPYWSLLTVFVSLNLFQSELPIGVRLCFFSKARLASNLEICERRWLCCGLRVCARFQGRLAHRRMRTLATMGLTCLPWQGSGR